MTTKPREQDSVRKDLVQRQKPTRRANIMRGIVAPFFALIAVGCCVFGILNAVVWKPSHVVNARTVVSNTHHVITDSGVLDIVDDTVGVNIFYGTKKSTSYDGKSHNPLLCVAVANAKDALGWIHNEPYVRITGLSTWKTLAVKSMTGNQKNKSTAESNTDHSKYTDKSVSNGEKADTSVAFQNSDMWDRVYCSQTNVHFSLDNTANRVLLINIGNSLGSSRNRNNLANNSNQDNTVMSDTSSNMPVTVVFHWTRKHVPNFAIPCFVVALLCVLLASLSASVFALEPHRRRHKTAMKEAKQELFDNADEYNMYKALSNDDHIEHSSTVSKEAVNTQGEYTADVERADIAQLNDRNVDSNAVVSHEDMTVNTDVDRKADLVDDEELQEHNYRNSKNHIDNDNADNGFETDEYVDEEEQVLVESEYFAQVQDDEDDLPEVTPNELNDFWARMQAEFIAEDHEYNDSDNTNISEDKQ